ncbi:hypothetical protein CsSME_00042821 [Camellia sinensis var. sinensis]
MTTGIIHDQNLEKHIEKQMGCMAGFFQRFDRNHILSGKRLYATKRLPPTAAVDSLDSVGSPAVSIELEKPQQTRAMTSPSPDRLKVSPVTEMKSSTASVVTPAKSQLPLPLFEFKEGNRSSWKFCKETPRLSLDSRGWKQQWCARSDEIAAEKVCRNGLWYYRNKFFLKKKKGNLGWSLSLQRKRRRNGYNKKKK